MKPYQVRHIQISDVVSRKPGRLDPLKADVGEVVARAPHFFTVTWTSAAMPPETFFDNNDPFLEELKLHKPDLH